MNFPPRTGSSPPHHFQYDANPFSLVSGFVLLCLVFPLDFFLDPLVAQERAVYSPHSCEFPGFLLGLHFECLGIVVGKHT